LAVFNGDFHVQPDDNTRFSLTGRRALVTGASSGIGRHVALTLAAAGADVALAARRRDRLQDVQKEIEALGRRALSVELDVTDRAGVERGFETAEAELGPIDVLINNAGTADTAPFLDMTEEAWSSVVETNLTGVWRVAQVAARRMAGRKNGSIINISSALGIAVQKNQANYAAAKAGVIQLTRVMALELSRYGIRVNAIAPGYFQTEINSEFFESPQGQAYVDKLFPRRLGNLDELDGPILLLASDAGSFMTGSVLSVEGGALLKSF
jgi:NAD(P)-dependent dehydrogenase (short-subunit alcohol dehydrogenase family)